VEVLPRQVQAPELEAPEDHHPEEQP